MNESDLAIASLRGRVRADVRAKSRSTPVAMTRSVNIVPFSGGSSQSADEHAQAETERKDRLFSWAETLLRELGFDRAIAAAGTMEELLRVVLDVDILEIALAIRAVLHPASKKREDAFIGVSKGTLHAIVRNRFNQWRKTREQTLGKSGKTRQAQWEDGLILNDKTGKPVANLANAELILRASPDWKGVFALDQFATRVVVRRIPPWGFEALGTPCGRWAASTRNAAGRTEFAGSQNNGRRQANCPQDFDTGL
jgi:hypothetical protein